MKAIGALARTSTQWLIFTKQTGWRGERETEKRKELSSSWLEMNFEKFVLLKSKGRWKMDGWNTDLKKSNRFCALMEQSSDIKRRVFVRVC